jgi:hypothetical protein
MNKAEQRLAQAGLISAALFFGVGVNAAYAQSTSTNKSDSSTVQQTDTTQSAPADATSRINQRARQDSMGSPDQNPPGYRGMERPAGVAKATSKTHTRRHVRKTSSDSATQAASDSTNRTPSDSTKWGYPVDTSKKNQNPAGFRGMERPAGLDSAQRNQKSGGSQDTSAMQSGTNDTTRSQ